MSLKMNKVNYNGATLKINDYNESVHHGKIKCIFCGIKVSYVKESKRTVGKDEFSNDIVVPVRAYFKRWKGFEHTTDCEYSVETVVKDIYAGCSDNEIMTEVDGKYVVRILLIAEDTDDEPIQPPTIVSPTISPHKTPNYIPKHKKAAYVNTLRKILELRMMVDSNKELSDVLKLQSTNRFGSTVDVKWNDFFYGINRYDQLRKSLEKRVYHAICVEGLSDDIVQYNKSNTCYLKLKAIEVDEKSGKEKRLSIMAKITSEKIKNRLIGSKGSHVLVYGQFYSVKENQYSVPNSASRVITYVNIRVDIHNENQVLVYR
ncbi:DNA-dependent RNA polymerase auxiliary subunit epsilon [Lachnospiraceae bacterium PF1-21]